MPNLTDVKLGATQVYFEHEIADDDAIVAIHTDLPLSDAQQRVVLGYVRGNPLPTVFSTHDMRRDGLHCLLVYAWGGDHHRPMERILERMKREILMAR